MALTNFGLSVFIPITFNSDNDYVNGQVIVYSPITIVNENENISFDATHSNGRLFGFKSRQTNRYRSKLRLNPHLLEPTLPLGLLDRQRCD